MGLLIVLVPLIVWALTQPVGAPSPRRAEGPGGGRIDLPVVCDLLRVAIGAGVSLPRACESVGEAIGSGHGVVLTRAARALRLGARWEEAWEGHVLAEVLAPAWKDGADPTPLLAALARSVRAGRAAAAKEAAARLAIHLVLPVGLCLLPAFILVGVVPLLIGGSMRILG